MQDFTITLSPGSQTVSSGGAGTLTLTASGVNGFNQRGLRSRVLKESGDPRNGHRKGPRDASQSRSDRHGGGT